MTSKLVSQFRRSIYTGSIGKVLSNYAPVKVCSRPLFFTIDGFNERFFRLKTFFRTIFSIFYVQRSLSNFTRKKFIHEALFTYKKLLDSFYTRDLDSLRSILTPNLYSDLSGKIKNAAKIQSSGPIKIIQLPSIVQILPIQMQIPQIIEIFQITLKIDYQIGRDKFTDYVVFERSAATSDSIWKICGKIEPNSSYFLK